MGCTRSRGSCGFQFLASSPRPGKRCRYPALSNCQVGPSNPYASPNSPPPVQNRTPVAEFVRGSKKGPALYIVLSAIGVTFVLALILHQFLIEFEPIGFTLPAVGSIIGAMIYRIRSRRWPIDPTAKSRIIKCSLIACLTPPAIMFVITGGGRAQGAAMVLICLLVEMSVAAGIILAGRRRDGRHGEQATAG